MDAKILVVDDEASNLFFLSQCLGAAGFAVETAADGMEALEKLQAHPDCEAILLDRMMPRMDGMEVLKRVKEHAAWRDLPVIMQTAAATTQDVMEGIEGGAYYYLTKPYAHSTLIAIARAAVGNARHRRSMRQEVHKHRLALGLMEQGRFRFRTLEEARHLASFVAPYFPDPEAAACGLSELMINAVEHGNLGITYAEKTQLLMAGIWQQEVEKRLTMEHYRHRHATLYLEISGGYVRVRISDQGDGFDWRPYLALSPERITLPHGRGIAIALSMGFSTIAFAGCGNEVVCTQAIAPAEMKRLA